jgi:4a-hydroxytetrahydrobiopterin dehydratase
MINWNIENKKLVREFEFVDFKEIIAFVNQVARLAEETKHHPDILIHSYNKARIILFTHDKNKITDADYSLAEKINTLV